MSFEKRYCTTVCCIDGKIVPSVIHFVQEYFQSEYVDVITEAGPAGILSDHPDSIVAEQIYSRVELSLEKHESVGLAMVAHACCLGNPKNDTVQLNDLRTSRDELKLRFPDTDIILLWVPSDETPVLVD